MKENSFKWPEAVEPLRTNRWVLKIGKVPSYLVRDLDIESFVEDDKTYTKLKFSLMNVIGYNIVPDDIITLKKIKLEFLDPTGVVVNGYDMRVEFDKMSFKCDYADGGILTHNFMFYVKNLNQLYCNIGEESEKEIVENYKKNKKKEKESV